MRGSGREKKSLCWFVASVHQTDLFAKAHVLLRIFDIILSEQESAVDALRCFAEVALTKVQKHLNGSRFCGSIARSLVIVHTVHELHLFQRRTCSDARFTPSFSWKSHNMANHHREKCSSSLRFLLGPCRVVRQTSDALMLSTTKRLQKELAALASCQDSNIVLKPCDGRITEWSAIIHAPVGSAYEGFEFDLQIIVPSNYPMIPPMIRFASKIFHPNVLFSVLY